MLSHREPWSTGKFTHGPFPRAGLFCWHRAYHIDHFPAGQLFNLRERHTHTHTYTNHPGISKKETKAHRGIDTHKKNFHWKQVKQKTLGKLTPFEKVFKIQCATIYTTKFFRYFLTSASLLFPLYTKPLGAFKFSSSTPTSSSGTPNLRRSCLAFFRERRRRSASVPVTVFLTGWGSLSSCPQNKTKQNR